MNVSEHIHECVGCWTDDGVWQITPGEPIVRCKDCEHSYEHHDARGRWLLCGLQLYDEVKPEDFCSRGVPVEEAEDGER